LYGTNLPVTTVALRYDAASLELTSVVQVQRKLVSVDAAVYQQRQADPAFAGKLVRAPSGEFLVVKEMTTSYQYLSVRHTEEALPVRMSDRVIPQAAGKFEPAAAYQSFTLNQR
jgi:hypothetical protein